MIGELPGVDLPQWLMGNTSGFFRGTIHQSPAQWCAES